MRRARLALAQTTSRPGEKQHNLERVQALISRAGEERADLVCLPELCTTGFAAARMAEVAEPIPGPTTELLGALARRFRLHVAAGLPEVHPKGKAPYNSAVIISARGEVAAVYRKLYLFPGEVGTFTPGRSPCLVELPFARAGVTICYDYVFPGYMAGLVDRGAELILHLTAWLMTPAKAELGYNPQAFRAVGMARAVENTAWFLSANQSGTYDDSGAMVAIGQSALIAPWGEVLAEIPCGEGVAVAEVDFDLAQAWRERVAPYLRDRAGADPWRAGVTDFRWSGEEPG